MIQDKSYPFFHENQVLTKGHLNSLVTYLEQQDRESRILDGSGIRCGLNVFLDATGNTIKLSPGSGITTQGYLLFNQNEIEYRYYQEFILPEGSEANYLYHSGNTRIKLYELLEHNLDPHDETEENKNAHEINNTLTPAPDITLSLHEMAVILHLEIVAADLTTCKIDSCDNEGFEQQLHWRALLIAKSDLKHLLQEDLGFSETAEQYFHGKYKVHEARIPLPKFNCSNTQSYAQIHQNYLYVCRMALLHLEDTFTQVAAAYDRAVSDKILGFDIDKLKGNLAIYEENTPANGIQYFYDHLKDIALAINEFTNAAFQYQYSCSLNQERYPNYLMAGSFRSGNYNDLSDDIYRHYFEPYCRDTASTNAHKELLNLYERVNALINSYQTDFVSKSATEVAAANRLFITPESRCSGKLGDLIPAYYYSNNYLLRRRWNPNNFAHQQAHDIPWYWQRENNEAADWMQDSNNALRFRLDSHNYYHIEGHLGMTRTAFEDAFKILKNRFNLEIDLKVLEAKHTDECEYKQPYDSLLELEALYEIEGKEIYCYLTKLFDMFKDDYQVEIDDTTDNTPTNLERCQLILENAYKEIVAESKGRDGLIGRSKIAKLILKWHCPGDKDKKTPSYYIVDLEKIKENFGKLGSKIIKMDFVLPLIIEYGGHHAQSKVRSEANVLYTDGAIDTLNTNSVAYRNLISRYVSREDEIAKPGKEFDALRNTKPPFVYKSLQTISAAMMAVEPSSHETMYVANNVSLNLGDKKHLSAIESMDELIATEENISYKKELLVLRGKILGAWYGSATEGEKPNIPLSTITVIDNDKSYTFYDYDESVAEAFYKDDEIDKLISMLAALVYRIRKTINDDEIETGNSVISGYISGLNALSENIALLLETLDDKVQKLKIPKCILLPIFIGIYQRCWASNFINIKLKYIEAKASILDAITLPQYIHKHPEVKHIGGAPVGGTLIVVFKSYSETALYDDFKNIILPDTWNGYTPEVLADYEAYVDNMGQGLTGVSGGGRNEIIVADLCLPYRCCADASSVEYVVFVELKLEMPDEVCSEMDRVQIQFTPDVAILSGKHVKPDPDDGLFYFASAGLNAGPYEVTLSLNDKTIKRTITVFPPPSATYAASPENAPDTVAGEKVWTFEADDVGMAYKWYMRRLDAADEVFDEVNNTIIAENDYELVGIQRSCELKSAQGESLDFELVLFVTNGPCRVYSKPSHYTYFPEVKWEITPSFFCKSLQKHELEYTPKDAKLSGKGKLSDKIESSADGYVLQVDDIAQGNYKIQMSLPNYDPIDVAIKILESPTASFQLLDAEPIDNGDGFFSLKFTADVEGYGYQWYLDDELLPGETDQTYIHSWEKDLGTEVVLELEVINNWEGERCSSKTSLKFDYEAKPVELDVSITFPEVVCADSGVKTIGYSPKGNNTRLTGSPDLTTTYVNFDKETREASFDTAGLERGKVYPIILLHNGKEEVNHPVEICKMPNLDFSNKRGTDPGTKKDYTIFKAVRPNDAFTYIWIAVFGKKEEKLHEGKEYKHKWPPDVNATLHIKLRVVSDECTCDSDEHTFINHDGGSLHLESLEYYLKKSLSAFDADTQIPEDLEMYVEKIIEANAAILENITPPQPDINPDEYALTKIDTGAVTRRIGSNLENTNMILDKLKYMEIEEEESKRVEAFIKATLAATSEILLAKTMDLDDSTETFDYLSNVIPKTIELFNITETTEAKPELMERLKTKTNISGFIEVVGKL